MIFKTQEAYKILRDEKTQARCPINHHTTDKFGICRTKAERPHKVEIAHVEIRHGQKERRREEVCVVNVTEVRRVRLGDLTPADAKAEGFVRNGFGAPDLFFARWRELHGPPIGPIDERQEVWLRVFERERDGAVVLSHIIEAPYGDYTTKPRNAADDVEAVSDAKVLDRFAKDNKARFTATHRDEIGQRDLRSSMERLKRMSRLYRDNASAASIIAGHIGEMERELEGRKRVPKVPPVRVAETRAEHDPSREGYLVCNDCNSRGTITLLDPTLAKQGATGPACDDCFASYEEAA